jgi:hypothetical protein
MINSIIPVLTIYNITNSPYIPISQYLQPTDVNNESISVEDRFTFLIDKQYSFFVYKSLACFLSSKSQVRLYLKKSELEISIQNIQIDPKNVIDSLVGLLSGSSLLIDQSNFTLFQKTFDFFEHKDYQLYFGVIPPETPTKFFLSINSLKGISRSLVETKYLDQLIYQVFQFQSVFFIYFGRIQLNFKVICFRIIKNTKLMIS